MGKARSARAWTFRAHLVPNHHQLGYRNTLLGHYTLLPQLWRLHSVEYNALTKVNPRMRRLFRLSTRTYLVSWARSENAKAQTRT